MEKVTQDIESAAKSTKNAVNTNSNTEIRGYDGVMENFLSAKNDAILLKNEQDINKSMLWNNSTALILKCQEGDTKYVQQLISMDANLNGKNDIGNSALTVAAEYGHLQIVKIFLSHTNALELIKNVNLYQQTPLMLAIESGYFHVCEAILDLDEVEQLKMKNIYGKNAILIACEFGKWDIFKSLFRRMVKINNNDITFVNTLVANVSDAPVKSDQKGNRMLMFACGGSTSQHEKIAMFLLKLSSINVEVKDKFDKMIFTWASNGGNGKVFDALYEKYGRILPDEVMKEVIKSACIYGYTDLINSVVKQSAKFGKPSVCLEQDQSSECLRAALIHGNLTLATIYFMIHPISSKNAKRRSQKRKTATNTEGGNPCYEYGYDNNIESGDKESPITDILCGSINDVLSDVEIQEMCFRVSSKPKEMRMLVILAAMYNFHFEIFMYYLRYTTNLISFLKEYFNWGFYQTLLLITNCKQDHIKINSCIDMCCIDNTQYDTLKINYDETVVLFPNYMSDVDAVNKVMIVGSLLQDFSQGGYSEAIEMAAYSEIMNSMLLEIFSCNKIARPITMQRFMNLTSFSCDDNTTSSKSVVKMAHAYVNGPIGVGIKKKLKHMFISEYIDSYIDTLLEGNMKRKTFLKDFSTNSLTKKMSIFNLAKSMIYEILLFVSHDKTPSKQCRNVINLSSNLIYLRYTPLSMFMAEGCSKGILLGLVARKCVYLEWDYFNYLIYVMFFGHLLYEYGELCQHHFISVPLVKAFSEHYEHLFNRLNFYSYSSLMLWVVWSLYGSPNELGAIAVSVVFLSIAMLKYVTVVTFIGHLTMMAVAMSVEIVRFAIIFTISIFGFSVAMYTLSRPQSSYYSAEEGGNLSNNAFQSKTMTFLSMFSAAMGNYNPNFGQSYPDFGDRFRELSIAIQITFIIFSAVLLLNLVIARMAATHDKIDKTATEEMQFTRGKIAMNFLLVDERSPLTMLPAPFNIITTAISIVFDFPRVAMYYVKSKSRWSSNSRHKKDDNDFNESDMQWNDIEMTCFSSTVSDWIIALLMSVVAPIIELVLYVYRCNARTGIIKITAKREVIAIITLFPIIYPFYVFSLLLEGFSNVNKMVMGKDLSKFSIVYNENIIPSQNEGEIQKEVIVIKLLRIRNLTLQKHMKSDNIIVRVQIQNMVLYSTEAFQETNSTCMFKSCSLKFPISYLDIRKDMKIGFTILCKNIKSDMYEIVDKFEISGDKTKQMIANGRYEGLIPMDSDSQSTKHTIQNIGVLNSFRSLWASTQVLPTAVPSPTSTPSPSTAIQAVITVNHADLSKLYTGEYFHSDSELPHVLVDPSAIYNLLNNDSLFNIKKPSDYYISQLPSKFSSLFYTTYGSQRLRNRSMKKLFYSSERRDIFLKSSRIMDDSEDMEKFMEKSDNLLTNSNLNADVKALDQSPEATSRSKQQQQLQLQPHTPGGSRDFRAYSTPDVLKVKKQNSFNNSSNSGNIDYLKRQTLEDYDNYTKLDDGDEEWNKEMSRFF